MSSTTRKISHKLRGAFTSSASMDELNIGPGDSDHLGPTRQERDTSVRHDPIGLRPRSASRADDRESIHGILAAMDSSNDVSAPRLGVSAGDELAPAVGSTEPSGNNNGEEDEDKEDEDEDEEDGADDDDSDGGAPPPP